ncbi:uncharacterized protein LOC126424931 isoform X2 [Schistocerca serialis cubense]|uniref:uncharacterized protein LOC126424931 isoform X2 n=1 Tax=Schistocerca serialis cubense TaxID=2023355 RepID=UPI00214EDF58|nr:uncharacterized protein LOC126424931 isoform X2 [Schistocerca serialis cubense]
MSKLLCSCAGRRRRRRGSSSSSRTPTPTPRAQRRRNFPRDDVLRVPPAGGHWAPGSKRDPQLSPLVVHPFPDVVAGQVRPSDTSQPPQLTRPQSPGSPLSVPPEARECSPLPPAETEPSAPTEMELSSLRSSTSDEGSLPMASRERLARSRETLPVDTDTAQLASSSPTRASCDSLRKTPCGSASAVDDPCCKDSGEVWVKMDPSSAVLPRRKISGRSPATSVDQVWSKAGARRRLHDSGAAWSTEDFTGRGDDDVWVRAKTSSADVKTADTQEQEIKPVVNERLSADRLHSVADGPGPSSQGTKGKSLTIDRSSAVKLKPGAKEDRSSFLNWLWTLFRSKRKHAKDETDPSGSKTQKEANATNETSVLQSEKKTDQKEKKILGEAARAVLTGSDFRLIDDDGGRGDVYEDACDGRVLPDAANKEDLDDTVINPVIAKRLDDIDEVLQAVYERNIAYGRSISMQRLEVNAGHKYRGDSRESSREADGDDKSSSHLSLCRAGETTVLLPEGNNSHKYHEKKISVGSSSPSSYYSHSRSESELTNDDEFLALGTPPHPPNVKLPQAGYMRLSEPNFSNAECARFKVGRFLQQSNDEQWFGHSDQSLEGKVAGQPEAISGTDDVSSTAVPDQGSAAVEDKLMKITIGFEAGVRAIRQDIEHCLASAEQASVGEASAAFISMESNCPKILQQPTVPALVVSEEAEDNDRDLCGFTDDGLDDILKTSTTTEMEADEWAGFDPAAWSREHGFSVPADSACYTSILPSGKKLVDVRQGEVEVAARNESWADIQRALQELVDSQDSALIQELKKTPEDETLLGPLLEETDLTVREDVSPLETGVMSAVTTSPTPHQVLSVQHVQSKDNDTPQTDVTKIRDLVSTDATKSTATVNVFPMIHPVESSGQVQSKDDQSLRREGVTAPKDPFCDSNFVKRKEEPKAGTQLALHPQFQEVPPVTGSSVVSPVMKDPVGSENVKAFFDEALDKSELPVQPSEEFVVDVRCIRQGEAKPSPDNLQSVSSVNVFTLSDETLNNLRSAAQNVKKSTALELIAPSEELFEDKMKVSETPSVDLLEDLPVAQGRAVTQTDTIKDITINMAPRKTLDAQNTASSSQQKFIPGEFNVDCTAEPHKETEVCSDILTLTETVPTFSRDSDCSGLTSVIPQDSNLQKSLISSESKENDDRDKVDSTSLERCQQIGREHFLLIDKEEQDWFGPHITKDSEVLQWKKPVLESAGAIDETYTSKAIGTFLSGDLVKEEEINIPVTAEKTVFAENLMPDQSDNLISKLADTSSDTVCNIAGEYGLLGASVPSMLNEQSRQDVDSKMPQSHRDRFMTHGHQSASDCQPQRKVADVGTPDRSMVSQLFDATWQAAQSEEEAANIIDTPSAVSPSVIYQSNEAEFSLDPIALSRQHCEKAESSTKSGSPYDVLEEFVQVSTSNQIYNLREQSHDLRDIADQLQSLKEQSHSSEDTKSRLNSLKEHSDDFSDVAGHLQNSKDKSNDFGGIVGQDSEGWPVNEKDQSNALRIKMGKTVDTNKKTISRDISTESVWLSLDRSLEDLKTPAVSFPPGLSSTSALLPSVDPLPDMQLLDCLDSDDSKRSDTKKNKIEDPFMPSYSMPQKDETTMEKSNDMFYGSGGRDVLNTLDSAWFPSEDAFFTKQSSTDMKCDSDTPKDTMLPPDKVSGSQQATDWWSEKGFDSLSPFREQDFSFTGEIKSEAPQQWDSYIWTSEFQPSNSSSSTPTDISKTFFADNAQEDYGKDPDQFAIASKGIASVNTVENKELQQKQRDELLDEKNTKSSTQAGYSEFGVPKTALPSTATSQPPEESLYVEQQKLQSISVTKQSLSDESAGSVNNIGHKAQVLKSDTTTCTKNEATNGDPVDNYRPSFTKKQEMHVTAVPLEINPPKHLHVTGDTTEASPSSKSVHEVEQRESDDIETLGSVAEVKVSAEEISVSSHSDSPPPLVDVSPLDTADNSSLPEVPGTVVEKQQHSDHHAPQVSTGPLYAEQIATPHIKSAEPPVYCELNPAEVGADTSCPSNSEQGINSKLVHPAKEASTSTKTSSASSAENDGTIIRTSEKSLQSGDSPLETDSYSEDSVFLDDEEGGDVLGRAGFILHPITRQLIRRSSSVTSEPPLSPTIAVGPSAVTPEITEEKLVETTSGGQVFREDEMREKPQSAGKADAVVKPPSAERRESVVLEKITALKHHISEGIQHGKDSVYSTERKLLEKVQSWIAPAEKPPGKGTEKVIVEEEDVVENKETGPTASDTLEIERVKSTTTTVHELENKIVKQQDEKVELFQPPSPGTSGSETKNKVAGNQDEKVNLPQPSSPGGENEIVRTVYAGPALKIDDTLQATSPQEEINVVVDNNLKEVSVGNMLAWNRAAKIEDKLRATSAPEEIGAALDNNLKECSVGNMLKENRATMETFPLTPEGDTIIEMEDFEYETIAVDRDPLLGQEFTILVKSSSDSEHSSCHSKTGVRSPKRLQASDSNVGTSVSPKNESPSCLTGHPKNTEADSHWTTDSSSSPVGSDHDIFFEDIPQQSLEYGSQTPIPFMYEEDGSDFADVECGDSSRPATSSSDDWYFSTSRSVDGGLAISYGPPSNASSRIDLRKLDTMDTTEQGNCAKENDTKGEHDILHATHLQVPVNTHKQGFLEVQHVDLKPFSGEVSPGGRSCASYDGPDYYDIEKRIDSVLKRIDALQESDPTFRETDSGTSGTNPFDMSEDEWLCMQSGVPQEGFAELPEEPTVEGCGSTVEEDRRFLEETYLNTGKKSGRLQRVCTRQNLDGKEDLDANPFSDVADRYIPSSGSVLSSTGSIPEASSDSGDQDKNSSSNPFLQTIYEKGLLSQSALSIDLPNPFLYTEAEIREQLRRAGFSSEEEIFPLSPPGGTVSEASSGVAGDRSCSPDSSSSDSSDGTLVQDPLPVLPVPTQEMLLPDRSPDSRTLTLEDVSARRETESIERDVDSGKSSREAGGVMKGGTEEPARGAGIQDVRSMNLPDVVSKEVDINPTTDYRGFQKEPSSDLGKRQIASGLPCQVRTPVDVDPSKLAVRVSGLSVRTETGLQAPSRFSVSLAVQDPSLQQLGSTLESDSCVFPADYKPCTSADNSAKENFQCRLPKDTTESVVGELPDLVGTVCSAVVEGGSQGGGGGGGKPLLPLDSDGTSTQQRVLREGTTNETSNDGSQQDDGALDLAQNSNVQDAFVIAVEQQARERLERLSALRRIKPIDMTKLSQQVSHQ